MHLQIIELEDDVKRLKHFARRSDKISHKRDVLLPKWLPIVEEFLTEKQDENENKIHDNPIFGFCIIWLFDIASFSRAIEYAFIAIDRGQPMPKIIKRKWPGFIADTVFEWADTEAQHGRSIEPYFGQVFSKVVNEWELPEPVTAKYYKFAGLALLRTKNGDVTPSHVGDIKRLQQADELLQKAAKLHKHAQVKTVRNKIAMRIRSLTELNAQ